MRRSFLAHLILSVLLAPLPLLAQQAVEDGARQLDTLSTHRRHLFNQAAPSVVFIRRGENLGSGFFVSDKGLILTNRHVVGEAEKVRVILHDGRTFDGEVIALATDDIDLALARISIETSPAMPLRDVNTLRIGDWAGSVNHGQGGIWTFNTGMISNIYPMRASTPVIQSQLPLNPGSSGGPLFDSHGRVFGVITTGIIEANNINFAIRLDAAFHALPQMLDEVDVLVITAPAKAPIFVDGRQVGVGPEAIFPVTRTTHEVFAIHRGKKLDATVRFPRTRRVTLGKATTKR